MDNLEQVLLAVSAILFAMLFALQLVPPLIRTYLRRPGPKRLKMPLCRIAFLALYCRVFARHEMRTGDGVVLSGSLRTNPLLQCVYLTGSYEPSLAYYVRQRVKPGDVFLDIGANCGHFSLIAANLGAEVIAVEASPANCRRFTENVNANAFDARIRLIQAAAGSENGEIVLHENPLNGMCSTTTRQVFWYLGLIARKIIVPMVKVDDVLDDTDLERIRFVKIDVEGAELNVLRGMSRLIRSGSENLEFCLELNPNRLTNEGAEEIFSTFRSNGYRAYTLMNQEVDFPPYDVGSPQLCLNPPTQRADLVFSRAGA